MAYLETSATSVHDLIAKLENFCKITLNWSVAGGRGFKPTANGETFNITDIYSEFQSDRLERERFAKNELAMTSGFTILVKSVKELPENNLYRAGCNLLKGFGRVWFSGDANNVFCVIESEKDSFRWFGFGQIPTSNPNKFISYAVGSFLYPQCMYDTYHTGTKLENMYGMYPQTTLFGIDGSEWTSHNILKDNYYSHLYYDGEVYLDKSDKLAMSGGYLSQHWLYLTSLKKSRITNELLLSEVPLLISRDKDLKKQIVGKIPLIYAVNISDISVPKELTFGGKRYMCFSVGTKRAMVLPANRPDADKHKIYTGEQFGFAIRMDD